MAYCYFEKENAAMAAKEKIQKENEGGKRTASTLPLPQAWMTERRAKLNYQRGGPASSLACMGNVCMPICAAPSITFSRIFHAYSLRK